VRDALLGLVAGVIVGSGVAVVGALVAKKRYESQGAAFTQTLAAQGQQIEAALRAGGSSFRTELEAVARASAQSIAIGRAATLLRSYGLDASTLAKLERLS
jgi:hypothetical protein